MPYKYLVSGVGHGGTRYMAKLLTSAGVPCAHEWIFGCGSWHPVGVHADLTIAESSWMVAPIIGTHPMTWKATLIHATRDPRDVIRSWMTHGSSWGGPWRKWVFMHLDKVYDRTSLHQCCEIYVRWNEMTSRHRPWMQVRVEDGAASICEQLGFGEPADQLFNNTKENTKVVPTQVRRPEWSELTEACQDMALSFGYKP